MFETYHGTKTIGKSSLGKGILGWPLKYDIPLRLKWASEKGH